LLNKIKMLALKTKWKSFLFTAYSLLAFSPLLAFAAPLVPCKNAGECNFNKLVELAKNIINLAITIAPMLAAVAFAVAGFYYITSAGDTGKVKQAHDIFTYTALGLVVVLAAWLIVNAILDGLGVGGAFNILGE